MRVMPYKSDAAYIASEVHDNLNSQVKTWTDGRPMWEAVRWDTFDNRIIYRSNWFFISKLRSFGSLANRERWAYGYSLLRQVMYT